MDRATTIWLHVEAPGKPAPGQPCNGCGVCCAIEPCPIGMLVSRSRRGRCRALVWDATACRYRCGLMPVTKAGRRASLGPRLRAWLLRRWIGAGTGCDSVAGVEPN